MVMRTQKTAQSLQRTSTFRRAPYVCSDCRRNASQIKSTDTAKSSHGPASNLQRPRFTAVAPAGNGLRWLHNSSRRPGPVDTTSSSLGNYEDSTTLYARDEVDVQDGKDVDEPLQRDPRDNATREDIRSRLRKWSEEQSRLANASGTANPSFGALPPNNSLLIEEDAPIDEDEECQVPEGGIDAEDETAYATNVLNLEPGDVFRTNMKGIHGQFCIFLGQRGIKFADVLLADGRWASARSHYPNQVILPGFATPEEANFLRSCVLEHPRYKRAEAEDPRMQAQDCVVGDLPMALTEDLTRRLSFLSEEIITFQRDNTATLDTLYTKFADPDKFVYMSFSELVEAAFNKQLEDLSMGARYAIFATLRKNEDRHTILRTTSNLVGVYFTPRTLYKQILDVTNWARQYQDCAALAAGGHDISAELRANPLNTFINKARRIILKSRKIRPPTTIGSLGPSSKNLIRQDGSVVTRDTGENFSSEDHSIIEFMWNTYLRKPYPTNNISAMSIGALILRAIGAYPKMQLNVAIARLFFRETGLQSPWSEDMDNELRIPAPGRRGSAPAQRLIKQTDILARKTGFTSDRSYIPLPDTMVTLRKDWGPAEVYCIDKPSTSTLDDGISLEDSDNTPEATWVHVHIAHPSAYIHPSSEFALRARKVTSAIYTTAKNYGMLPEDMLNAMSLRANASVMTVSSLILENGAVGEIKISVGTIRKIIRLDPDAVDVVRGIEDVEKAVLQVGPTIAKREDFDMSDYQDAEKHADFIRKLDNLIKARTKKRREEYPDYPRWKHLVPNIQAHVSWSEVFDGSRHNQSYHYLGDPTIRMTTPREKVVKTYDQFFDRDMDLTAHTMVLAGESIARWLKERNIPVVYNGALPNDDKNTVAKLNETGYDDPATQPTPRTLVSSRPVAHTLMGIPQYVRITSPLRRYTDGVAQWQVDAYLKAEAEGRLPPSGDLQTVLPFTTAEIEKYIQEGGHTNYILVRLQQKATLHWNMQALFRAFHFNEAPLPAIWDAQITQPNIKLPPNKQEWHSPPECADLLAFLQPFFARTRIIKSKEGWEIGVKRFQYLPVKIEYVDTTGANVYVRPVGPPSWTATQTGPLHCVKPENEAPAKGHTNDTVGPLVRRSR